MQRRLCIRLTCPAPLDIISLSQKNRTIWQQLCYAISLLSYRSGGRSMKFVTAVVSFMLISMPTLAQGARHKADLNNTVKAYKDARMLGQKASTFLHARAAYRLARKIYLKEPDKLAPFSWRYAKAAATYGDPLALFLYERTLDLHIVAYGHADARLATPLIDAADEALRQNELKMAYAWYNMAHRLLAQKHPDGNFDTARILMGLARLHMGAGQLKKARQKAQVAVDLLHRHYPEGAPATIASMIYRHGEIEQASGKDAEAFEAYTQSLKLYMEHDASAPDIFGLHKRLMEVNHTFERASDVTAHCLAAQKFHYAHNKAAIFGAIYDPTGRLSGPDRQKQGKIRATFRKGADCRLHDIEIHHADGISQQEAKTLLAQTYYAPIMMRGIIAKGEYLTYSTMAIYKK